MAFESPLFLIALTAAAVPVIIHLIFRVRKLVVIFGSNRFLDQAVKKHKRRLRLRDILLLLMRVALIALVALAFARPTFDLPPDEEGADARRDVVFVLDDSLSMSAGRLARTNLDEAKARVLEAISALRPGDRAGLVLTSGGGRVASGLTTDFGTLGAKVRSTGPTYEKAELAPSLRAALGLLSVADQAPVRRVAVASDLQKTSWTKASLLAALSGLGSEGVEYEVILPAAETANLAVVGAACETDVWSPGTPVTVRARVANFGKSTASGVAVRLRVGSASAPRAERTVSVPGGSEVTVELAFAASAPGEYAASVEVESGDALVVDDTRRLVLHLRDRVRVLVVSDAPFKRDEMYFKRGAFLDDGAYFLSRALDPRRDETEPPLARYEPVEIAARDLDATALRGADVVIALGGAKVSEGGAALLAEHVRAGAGVAFAADAARPPGDEIMGTSGALGEHLVPEDSFPGEDLLPARVGRFVDATRTAPLGTPVTKWEAEHPIWSVFKGESGTSPGRAHLLRFRELEPVSEEGGEPQEVDDARVLAEVEGGRPVVIERRFGKGRVVQLAFALSPEATDFPKLKAFVPFVHGLVGHLARADARGRTSAVEVGRPLPLGELVAGPHETGSRVVVYDPDGSTVDLPHGGVPPLAERPGVYSLVLDRMGRKETRLVAVNVPPAESDLRSGGEAGFLDALADDQDPEKVAARASVLSGEGAREPSKLWAVCLAVMAAALVIESLVANRVLLETGAET
jgi:hypothetical protein